MSDSILDMTGKVVFITGASSRGIGSGAAKLLAKHGASVFLTARREQQLQEQVAEIEAAGGKAGYAVCDVSCEDQVNAAVQMCIDLFGRLDGMILTAGIAGAHHQEVTFDSDDWRKVVGINLDGVYYSIAAGYPHLKESGNGVIIPIMSLAGLKVAGGLPYTATKGAIARMVPWCAKKMGPDGIRVNSVAPGLIDTDMTNPPGFDTTDMILKPAAQKAPLRRCATIEDCANALLFLCSDASRCITGEIITVDGGERL